MRHGTNEDKPMTNWNDVSGSGTRFPARSAEPGPSPGQADAAVYALFENLARVAPPSKQFLEWYPDVKEWQVAGRSQT